MVESQINDMIKNDQFCIKKIEKSSERKISEFLNVFQNFSSKFNTLHNLLDFLRPQKLKLKGELTKLSFSKFVCQLN